MTYHESMPLAITAGGRLLEIYWPHLFADLSLATLREELAEDTIHNLEVEQHDGRFLVAAQVQLSGSYKVELAFNIHGRKLDLRAYCQCAKSEHYCRHTAVVLLLLEGHYLEEVRDIPTPNDFFAKLFDEQSDSGNSSSISKRNELDQLFSIAQSKSAPARSAQSGVSVHTGAWLDHIAQLSPQKDPSSEVVAEHFTDLEPGSTGLIYRCGYQEGWLAERGGLLRLEICRIKRLKSGVFNKPTRIPTRNLIQGEFAKYIPQVERKRINQMFDLCVGDDVAAVDYRFFPVMKNWVDLVWDMLEDEVIVFDPNEEALEADQPRSIEACWIGQHDGTRLSGLRFSDTQKPAVLFNVEPPIYVDQDSGTWGEAHMLLPSALTPYHWLLAPAIGPEEFHAVNQALNLPDSEFASLLVLPKFEQTTISGNSVEPKGRLVFKCINLLEKATGQEFSHYGFGYPEDGDFSEFPVAELSFVYGDHRVEQPLSSAQSTTVFSDDKIVRIDRNIEAEKQLASKLLDTELVDFVDQPDLNFHQFAGCENYFCKPDFIGTDIHDFWVHFSIDPSRELQKQGWIIEFDPSFYFQVATPGGWYNDFSGSSHDIDWLAFDHGFEIDGKKYSVISVIAQALQHLPDHVNPKDLLEAGEDEVEPIYLPEEQMLVPMPSRQLGRLIVSLSELFDYEGGEFRLHSLRAAQVANEFGLDDVDDSDTLKRLRKLGKQIESFDGIKSVKIPKALQAELRPYQHEGLNWLQFLRSSQLNGILADDMGLGKTVQTLANLQVEKSSKRQQTPTLIIAPTSVVTNWIAEVDKFAPKLKALLLHGNDRKAFFDDIDKHDLVVTSYALLNRDIDIHLQHDYHYVILDEAQLIKNPKSKMAQNACKLKSKHRLCLTGTPMENHLGELWSIVHFLMPGFLGDYARFRKNWQNPIEVHDNTMRREQLVNKIAPLILRRTKDLVLKELPPRTDIVHEVTLDKAQTELYESVRAAMDKRVRGALEEKGLNRSHIIVLDALLKLRQICCHPQLLKTESAQKLKHSAKLEAFEDLVSKQVEAGRRILVFSQFTSMIAIIEQSLDKLDIGHVKLTGSTRKRKEVIDQFQEGDVPVFLISLKAGGSGLNLTAADCVIHYDPWWNPAVEEQATARAHRMGQQNPIFVYRLVTKGSIEERILEMQEKKAELARAVLSGGEATEETGTMKTLTQNDLEKLLAPIDAVS